MGRTREGKVMVIMKRLSQGELDERHILAMWLMFLRMPGRKTASGEPVDLGEIGQVREKDWERLTPYSPAVPSR